MSVQCCASSMSKIILCRCLIWDDDDDGYKLRYLKNLKRELQVTSKFQFSKKRAAKPWCMKEGTHLHIHKKALTKGPFAEPEGDSKQAPSNTEYNSFK